jgi:hypothetical protein
MLDEPATELAFNEVLLTFQRLGELQPQRRQESHRNVDEPWSPVVIERKTAPYAYQLSIEQPGQAKPILRGHLSFFEWLAPEPDGLADETDLPRPIQVRLAIDEMHGLAGTLDVLLLARKA